LDENEWSRFKKKKTDGQFSKIAGDPDPSLQAAAVCLYLFD
jgi:hypothetical protein